MRKFLFALLLSIASAASANAVVVANLENFSGTFTVSPFGSAPGVNYALYFSYEVDDKNNHATQAGFGRVYAVWTDGIPTYSSPLVLHITPNDAVIQMYNFTYEGGPGGYLTRLDPIAAAVPEPSTWAMLLIGFVGVGFMTYRRRIVAVAA
jgi:hypothetical protein